MINKNWNNTKFIRMLQLWWWTTITLMSVSLMILAHHTSFNEAMNTLPNIASLSTIFGLLFTMWNAHKKGGEIR